MTEVRSKWSMSIEHWQRLRARGLATAKKVGARAAEWSKTAGARTAVWSKKGGRRLRTLLQELELVQAPSSPLPLPGRVTQHREASKPIPIPAQGYVHAFKLRAAFTWSSEGLRPDMLSWYAHYFMPLAIERLTRLAATHSRNFEPHAAQELEEELQRVLGTMDPWRYEQNGMAVTCRPHVRVELDDRIKQALLPVWDERAKLDHEQDLHIRRAQHAKQLSQQWVTILQKLVDASVASEAAKAWNGELASALQRMMILHKAANQWIDELLGTRVREDNPGNGNDASTSAEYPERHDQEASEQSEDPPAAGDGSTDDSDQPGER